MSHSTDSGSLVPIETARANALTTDWDNYRIPVPWFLGRRLVEPRLAELVSYINWSKVAAVVGAGAAAEGGGQLDELTRRGRAMLDRIAAGNAVYARGVYGFWPANSLGDDIVVYKDDARARALVRFHTLRQQKAVGDGDVNLALVDFVAPKESFAPDYIGAFAVVVRMDNDVAAATGAAHADDVALANALPDALAEAFAELLHQQARNDWGYAQDEQLSPKDLTAGRYRGIRVAFGAPAAPDPHGNVALCRLLHAGEIGITCSETGEMGPAHTRSGLYFSHPESRHFEVGPIGADQQEDYDARKADD